MDISIIKEIANFGFPALLCFYIIHTINKNLFNINMTLMQVKTLLERNIK